MGREAVSSCLFDVPENVWGVEEIVDAFGNWGFPTTNLLDVDDPRLDRREENRLRAEVCDLELQRDGFDRGKLGEILERGETRIIILAGHSRSGKTSARKALARGLDDRENLRRLHKKPPPDEMYRKITIVPWICLRELRSGETKDKRLDRVRLSPAIVDRLIEEDWGRDEKRIAAAVNTAYHPYLLLARDPVDDWHIRNQNLRQKLRHLSLEWVLRKSSLALIECSPDMGIMLKRIFRRKAHLMLVMSRDTLAAGRPRPGVSTRMTAWRQAQSDLCWLLLRHLLSEGRPHWMFDSLILPRAFELNDRLGKSVKRQLADHTVYIGNDVCGHSMEVYRLLDEKADDREGINRRAQEALLQQPAIEDRHRQFLLERRTARVISILPPPQKDPTLEILEIFRALPQWGLIGPGRRERSHWIQT